MSNRVAIANENVPNMVGQISTASPRQRLNIADLLNKSRGDLAYTLIDMDAPISAELLQRLRAIRGRAVRAARVSPVAAAGRRPQSALAANRWRQRTPLRQENRRPGGRRETPARMPLEHIRERIDSVDAHLHALINERARLAQQVGVSKHAAGHIVDFYRPEREAQVLRLALQRNRHRARCATRRSCGCSAKSCRRAWRSRTR